MLLSIITVTLNKRASLRRSIHSLSPLTCHIPSLIEHLIVDGSKAGEELIDLTGLGYSDLCDGEAVSNRRVLKEPDDGIYQAMEKGVSISRGQYIWFLNDDDYLEEVDVNGLVSFLELSQPKVAVGMIIYREMHDGRPIDRRFHPQSISYLDLICDQSLRRLPHPASIVRKETWPPFDHTFRMIADYVAFTTVLGRGITTTTFPSLRVVMVRSENQLSQRNRELRNSELIAFNGALPTNIKPTLMYRARLLAWVLLNWRSVLKKRKI